MARAAIKLLFLLTDLASSYATTQHRVSYIVDRLYHDQADIARKDGCEDRVRYTHFREAKKAGVDFQASFDSSTLFSLSVSIREFSIQVESVQHHVDVDSTHTRGPPQL